MRNVDNFANIASVGIDITKVSHNAAVWIYNACIKTDTNETYYQNCKLDNTWEVIVNDNNNTFGKENEDGYIALENDNKNVYTIDPELQEAIELSREDLLEELE
ncbi:MAG: hypothetical protein GY830_03510 [Bacteroidetes bacterium]|nr:hypothetical protein [Bacteroidota bacterium]